MNPQMDRISKPLYMTCVTYLLISVFQSGSVQTALVSALNLFIAQLILFPTLSYLSSKVSSRVIPFAATAVAVLFGVILTYLMGLLFGFSLQNESVFFPYPSFLLLAVPLFVTQAKERPQYSFPFVMKGFWSFFPFLIIVSSIREVFGFGTWFGRTVFSSNEEPLPFLTHVSGSAFLIMACLLLFLVFFRAVTRSRLVLDTVTPFYQKQPVVHFAFQAGELRLFLAVCLVTFVSAIPLYIFSYFVYVPDYPYFLLASVLLLSAVSSVFRFFISKRREFCDSFFDTSYLVSVQTGIIAFPSSMFFSLAPGKDNAWMFFLLLAIFLLVSCLAAVAVLLFIRSLRRKSLFGKRPEILQGVPYLLLILSLCFMVLAGFGDVPSGLLSNIPF